MQRQVHAGAREHLLARLAFVGDPALVFFGVWYWLTAAAHAGRRARRGLMSIGKTKAKVYVETDTKVTFADVAGVDEAKDELQEVVDFLKDPKQYGRLGARMPKGVLLVGPPGTGKTLLAQGGGGRGGRPVLLDLRLRVRRDVRRRGRGARARPVRAGAAKAPAIIFIDELDALGRARGLGRHGRRPRREGADAEPAPRRARRLRPAHGPRPPRRDQPPEILDPALLRAGRFDRQVLVDRPTRRAASRSCGPRPRR